VLLEGGDQFNRAEFALLLFLLARRAAGVADVVVSGEW
jgi:hypothetical protein